MAVDSRTRTRAKCNACNATSILNLQINIVSRLSIANPAGGGGRGYRDRPPQPRVRDTLPDDVKQLTSLQPAHKRTITAMEVDVSTQLLYTGSQDGHVKAWSCADGKVTSDVDVGGEVRAPACRRMLPCRYRISCCCMQV